MRRPLVATTLLTATVIAAAASPGPTGYVLACGGCHGVEGVSNPALVPQLRGQVGYFLATRRGRAYLVRLPNVAFCAVSDAELADILNYTVFAIGGHGMPVNAKPYTAFEVGALRKSPLNEISLIDYRRTLVEDLIAHHGAPVSLRMYSNP